MKRTESATTLMFDPPEGKREVLILKLFSTPIEHIDAKADLKGAFAALFRRSFRAA